MQWLRSSSDKYHSQISKRIQGNDKYKLQENLANIPPQQWVEKSQRVYLQLWVPDQTSLNSIFPYVSSHPFRSSWNFHSLWLSTYLGRHTAAAWWDEAKKELPHYDSVSASQPERHWPLTTQRQSPSGTETQEISFLILSWKKYIRSIQKLKELPIAKICLL